MYFNYCFRSNYNQTVVRDTEPFHEYLTILSLVEFEQYRSKHEN